MEPIPVAPEPSPAEPIGVGLIGLGRMGIHHAQRFQAQPRFRIVAVCDPDQGRGAIGADLFGARATTDPADLLADVAIDLVVVATPPALHAELALRCLDAGKATVVEKPLALSAAEADRVLAASRRTGRPLTVAHTRRWDGSFRTVRQVVQSGRLGEIYNLKLIGWVYSPLFTAGDASGDRGGWRGRRGGGALVEWGSQYLDQALVLAGRSVVDVFAAIGRRRWTEEVEESFLAVLRFEGGMVAQVEFDRTALAPSSPEWIISGSRAGYRDGAVYYPEGAEVVTLPVERLPTDWEPFYTNLADHLRHGAPLAVAAEDAVQLARVIDALRRSAASRQVVRLDPLAEGPGSAGGTRWY